ncbi:MAG: DUF4827 domain-containing protein [Prevotella sp.]|nr:DUF4827 domain-containing protein [Prevotella sp.]MDE6689634.1 DUF4827 domain-containing protein [Prevotella sp.]
MRKAIIALLAFGCILSFVACNDYETYGDQKEKERNAIHQFIKDSSIVVISESDFHAKGDITDVSKNEFVYLNNSGVYMQIVRKGVGKPIQDGERTTLLVRFFEMCLMDSAVITNDYDIYDPDLMNISRTGKTYTASFTQGLMKSVYGSSTSAASVPAGLLVPFAYINVGRERSDTDRIAKVRLIVPHTQGHTYASSYVYPYYYEMTFQRINDL